MLRQRPPGNGEGHKQVSTMSLSALMAFVAVILALPLLPIAAASNREFGSHHDAQDKALGVDQKWPAVALTAHAHQIHERLHAVETPKFVGRSTHPYPLLQKQNNNKNNSPSRPSRPNNVGYRNAHDGIHDNTPIQHDVRALTTLAPAQAVRAPPRQVDVSLPQAAARRLNEWAVEEFVLLATVDGDLHAMERRTGRHMWHIASEPPMVQTVHYPTDDDGAGADDSKGIVWAVEPTGDGAVYIWNSNAGIGLMRTGFTMKQLVEQMAGYKSEGPAVVYTGSKQTVMLTIDAATGHVLKRFGNSNYYVSDDVESCTRPTSLYGQAAVECMGTITLGRTEYTVEVQRYDGRPIATLKYSEWVPNSFDRDLVRQYEERLESFDHQYILTGVDGSLAAWDYSKTGYGSNFVYGNQYNATIGRVFDVCRPAGSEAQGSRELVILPHPPPSREVTADQFNTVYLNQTGFGSWYALSATSYPLALDAPFSRAESSAPSFRRKMLDSDYLVGKHIIDNGARATRHVALLPAPPETTSMPELGQLTPQPPAYDVVEAPLPPTIIEKVKSLPQDATARLIDWFSNPVLYIIAVVFVFRKQHNIRRWYKSYTKGEVADAEDDEAPIGSEVDAAEAPSEPLFNTGVDVVAAPQDKPTTSPAEIPVTAEDQEKVDAPSDHPPAAKLATVPEETQVGDSAQQPETDQPALTDQPTEKPKKKAHRGRRSGVAHRKKKKLAEQSDNGEAADADSVDEAVNNAKKLVTHDTSLQPDVQTIGHDMQDIGAGILRMGNMEVDMNTQLGTGSNGTLVFAGKSDGHDVAIKRMLVQFYDIASHETKLLRQSDNHPNVIRYYEQKVMQSFLYIALERCAASLADVIEKPNTYRVIATAGEQDMREVLRQIASGICHLHELRIVHRDLKPHNILIKIENGKPCLKVSDFGLCKKLENMQSSFGATTGRAAGTCGWRAPELLLDDDSPNSLQPVNPGSGLDASSDGGSGSLHVGMPGNPQDSNPRRATRSIDIFSLGLVFFYVLTRGQHPFDCGDRYMREVNIRKGNFNLSDLDILGGDMALEARDLIIKMICPNPKQRITAPEVLAHPFFWDPKKRLRFLCEVSDGFEKEQRDPPSDALETLESFAKDITKGDFLKRLPSAFVDSLGKQRKYTGSRLLDLLRALRNKRNHYEDLEPPLKRMIGGLWNGGYTNFWTSRFPSLLLSCWNVVYEVGWSDNDQFAEYYSN